RALRADGRQSVPNTSTPDTPVSVMAPPTRRALRADGSRSAPGSRYRARRYPSQLLPRHEMPNRPIAETPRCIYGISPDGEIAIMSTALAAQASSPDGRAAARASSPEGPRGQASRGPPASGTGSTEDFGATQGQTARSTRIAQTTPSRRHPVPLTCAAPSSRHPAQPGSTASSDPSSACG
ncbi:MAG: hypothetical protein ACJAQ3_002954, partial [Planctomycetota bacterium]